MEDWQKTQIKNNLSSLVDNTLVNAMVFAILEQEDVLSEYDVAQIEAEKTNYGQAKLLYKILVKKENGYYHLYKALTETQQSGATKFLFHPYNSINKLRVYYQGTSHQLSNLLTADQIQSIGDWLLVHSITEDHINTTTILNDQTEIKLLRDTIPKPYALYVPRLLFRCVVINSDLFKQLFSNDNKSCSDLEESDLVPKSCPDIFVVRGITRAQLRNLGYLFSIQSSTKQLLNKKITSSFILLDNDNHWKKLCAKADVPVHLIKYEVATENFVLEATSGVSPFLRECLQVKDETNCESLPEEDFIQKILHENIKGVCICDLPGMGKSDLLASLARNMSEKCPNSITAFIPLRTLELPENLPEDIRLTIFDQICTSKLASRILYQLCKQNNTKLELFFDGLDEVQEIHMERMTNFLRKICESLPEARIFVASRPVVRSKLEETLSVIAYDILPFNETTQRNYLTGFWSQDNAGLDMDKLEEFAEFCLHNLKKSFTESNRDIAGIPLQCRLIGQVYSDEAAVYADKDRNICVNLSNNLVNSLWEIYSRFIIRQLGESKCDFACVHKVGMKKAKCDVPCQVKSFHVWQALQLVLPSFANQLGKYVAQFGHLALNQVLSPGLLEIGQNKDTFIFVHRTFAEYLIAEYFAKAVFAEGSNFGLKNSERKLIQQLALKEIFFPGEKLPRQISNELTWQHHTLREGVIAHFLNEIATANEPLCISSMSMLDTNYFPALEGCLHGDYLFLLKIFVIATQNFQPGWFDKWLKEENVRKIDLEDDQRLIDVYGVLHVATKYCTGQTFKTLMQFIVKVFNVNLHKINSPIKVAVERADYEIVQYFLENGNCSLKNQRLLCQCFKDSYFDDELLLDTKLDIALLLLQYCPELIHEHEKDFQGHFHKGPIFAEHIDLKALKFLVEKGAQICVSDGYGRTVLYFGAIYMSEEDFWKLCDFLFIECKTGPWFLQNTKFINKAVLQQDDCLHTITEIILKVLGYLSIKAEKRKAVHTKLYEQAIQLIFFQVMKEGLVEIADLLLAMDNSLLESRDHELSTPLHQAACGGKKEMILWLFSKGANIFSVDSNEQTFLHIAQQNFYKNDFDEILRSVRKHWKELTTSGNYSTSQDEVIMQQPENIQELFNWPNKKGFTLLYCEAQGGHKAQTNGRIELLLGNSVDLIVFCGQKSAGVKVDINAVDKDGRTPLLIALEYGQSLKYVKHLVQLGADWKLTDNFGRDVVDYCVQGKLEEHLKYFKSGCTLKDEGEKIMDRFSRAVFKFGLIALIVFIVLVCVLIILLYFTVGIFNGCIGLSCIGIYLWFKSRT